MDYLSARRQRMWEAMESCRSGSDDLSDPQFADLAARLAEDPELRGQFQRLQEADEAIRAAFANVSVPAGLADRVSRRLAEALPTASSGSVAEASGFQPASDCVAAPTVTPHDGPTPLGHPTGRFSRRRLLVGFTALATAVVLLVAVLVQIHRPRSQTATSVLRDAMEFFGTDIQAFGPKVSDVAPPVEFPMSPDIVRSKNVRWRHVENFPGGPAVAYDLPPLGGRATLYVFQGNVPGLGSIPPPCLSTGGKSAAAWRAGDTVYVLVVEGDARMYSRYLDPSYGPLT
jgi:hypothetical protein